MELKRRSVLIVLAVGIAAILLWWLLIRTDQYGLTAWHHGVDLFTDDDWVGWIYPFGPEGRAIKVGPFNSLGLCQQYAFEHLQREYDAWETAEYYCGYQCTVFEEMRSDSQCQVVRK